MRIASGEKFLLKWLYDQHALDDPDSMSTAERSKLRERIGTHVSRLNECWSLASEETISKDVDRSLSVVGLALWLLDSLEEDGSVPHHVLGLIALRYPKFMRLQMRRTRKAPARPIHPVPIPIDVWPGMIFYMGHSEELPTLTRAYAYFGFGCSMPRFVWDFVHFLRCENWDLLQRPWFPAIYLSTKLDARFMRMVFFMKAKNRLRIKPHPPFEEWYSRALAYPLPDDPQSYRLSYSRKERDRLLERAEECLRANVVEGYRLSVMFRESFCGNDLRVSARGEGTPAAFTLAANETPSEIAPDTALGLTENEVETTSKEKSRRAVVEPILKDKGWSLEEWANKAGVDRRTIFDYLKGKTNPRPMNLKAMADSLGLTVRDLP